MRPTIAVFSGIFAPDTGGPAKFAESFLNYGEETGINVRIFAYSDLARKNQVELSPNVHLIERNQNLFLKYFKMIRMILRESRRGSYILANGCFWEIAIARHLKEFAFFTKIPGDIVWERARNQGFTSKSIDVFQTQKLTLKFWFLRYLFSYALNNSKRVIVPSDHLGSLCRIWGVQQEKITKISNSVKSPTAPDKLGFKREFDFITVSRLVSWKGIKEVIRAVALLDARLLIVGDGPERQELEELAFQLKADVVFTGESSQREIPILLRQASSFVLNSDFEATSYALLEAQAEGLIVIANAGTGSEEIISHKLNGLLCGEKTGLSLEQAMRLTLETGEEIQFMRDAARINVAKNFNIEINYKQISNLCIHDH